MNLWKSISPSLVLAVKFGKTSPRRTILINLLGNLKQFLKMIKKNLKDLCFLQSDKIFKKLDNLNKRVENNEKISLSKNYF